jgi:hypothetical protein
MKKILSLATAFALTLGAFAQTTTPVQPQPKAEEVIKINVDKHDFGKIVQNTPVTYSFEIKNISDKPVVIENTWASCGCTTPEKITDPILPGKTASLKVQYNAAAVAPFTKDVFIKVAGFETPKTVQITGEVLTAEAYEAYKKGTKTDKDNNPSNAAVPAEKQPTSLKATPATTTQKPKLTKD